VATPRGSTHRPRLPLLDSTASPLAGVVRAVAPRMDAPGDDARDHRDRDLGAVADRGSRPLGAVGASGALHGVRAPGVRQLAIALTGNYGFFNLLAIVLCLSLLDDDALGRVLPLRLAAGDPEPRWKQYAIPRARSGCSGCRGVWPLARESQTLPARARPRGSPADAYCFQRGSGSPAASGAAAPARARRHRAATGTRRSPAS